MINIDILTIFPEIFDKPFNVSIIKRAKEKKLISIRIHNLRDWTRDKRGTVDDRPFGGGVGMIMKVEPIFDSLETIKSQSPTGRETLTVLLSPQGVPFNQKKAYELSKMRHLILICGHYEGVDERVRDFLADEEISIGDYVLTGGEFPAMVLVDAITRLLPGVLDKKEATEIESFSLRTADRNFSLLEYPQYTRPKNFRGLKVPEVLLSGDHKKIEDWRKKMALLKTKKKRPDLITV